MPKTEKIVKLCNWLQNATAWTKINVWWRPVVLQKNAKKWKNFETLQLAAECHSINKNQRFIKIKPVVPKNNAKNWETLQLAAECHSMNKNQCLMKPVVLQKNAKKWKNFETLQLAAECHSINKNQSLIKIKPVVPEKNAKKWSRKFVKLCNWLQNATAWTKINVWSRPVVPEKNAKKWENFETLQLAAECHSINKNQSLIKIK